MTSTRTLPLVALAVLCAGCANSIVATAGTQDTPTTKPVTAPAVVYARIQRLSDLAEQSLKEHLPTKDEIARSGIEVLRTRTLGAITSKLTVLNSAELVLNDTTHLNAIGVDSGRAEISGAVWGLTALRSSIGAQSSIVQLRRDASGLVAFSDVGTLIVPKVVILGAADGVLRSDDTIGSQVTTIEKRISDAQARGKPVAAAQTALSDLKAKLTQSSGVAQGLLASVPTITADRLVEISADQAVLAGPSPPSRPRRPTSPRSTPLYRASPHRAAVGDPQPPRCHGSSG